jgi:ParB family chromosome partitioning protein
VTKIKSAGHVAGKTKTKSVKARPAAAATKPTSSAPPAVAPSQRFAIEVQLVDIQPDPNQPRKISPSDDFSDIIATLEVHGDGAAVPGRGIREPISIRKTPPHLPQDKPWTILKGERRYRASWQAGLATTPAFIVEIAEADVLGEQLLENMARRDLSPLEISDALERMQQEHKGRRKLSAEELAHRVGLPSARSVYRYLAMSRLATEVRVALVEGKIERLGVALALATIEDHETQKEAMLRVQNLDVRSARSFIESQYHLRLVIDACGFDPADASLPGGLCEACPKNTKAQRDLWAESEDAEGRCTDRVCFAQKKATTAERRVAAAEAAGAKVLSTEEAKQILPDAWSNPRDAGYLDLDAPRDRGKDELKWRDILGPSAGPAVVVQDEDGRVRELVPLRDAAATLRACGDDAAAQELEDEAQELEGDAGDELPAKDRETRKLERKAIDAAEEEAVARIVETARSRDGLPFWRFYAGLVIREVLDAGDEDELEPIAKRRGIKLPKGDEANAVEPLLEWLKRTDIIESDCRALLVEIAVTRRGYYEGADPDASPFLLACRFAGVDFEQILRERRVAKGKVA